MPVIRRSTPGEQYFPDHNVDLRDKAIQVSKPFPTILISDWLIRQTLEIRFPETAPFPWPRHFENHLRSRTYRQSRPAPPRPARRTRAQHQTPDPVPTIKGKDFRFEGQGYDEE
jgi:hypothetical protein